MIVPSGGTHIVCTTCNGRGKLHEEKRAAFRSDPYIVAMGATRPCPGGCEGTGWLPPKHPNQETEQSESDGEE